MRVSERERESVCVCVCVCVCFSATTTTTTTNAAAVAAASMDTCDTRQRNHIKFSRSVPLVVVQTAANYTIRHCHWDGIYEVTLNAESKGGGVGVGRGER